MCAFRSTPVARASTLSGWCAPSFRPAKGGNMTERTSGLGWPATVASPGGPDALGWPRQRSVSPADAADAPDAAVAGPETETASAEEGPTSPPPDDLPMAAPL